MRFCMRLTCSTAAAAAIIAAAACHRATPARDTNDGANSEPIAAETGERHLARIRQLTQGVDNAAEAYFSADGTRIIFQATRDGRTCDQQYVMNADGSNVRRVSNGTGKTTCGYFFDGDRKIFYASTFAADSACPPRPDPSKGYVRGLDPFDIYT